MVYIAKHKRENKSALNYVGVLDVENMKVFVNDEEYDLKEDLMEKGFHNKEIKLGITLSEEDE